MTARTTVRVALPGGGYQMRKATAAQRWPFAVAAAPAPAPAAQKTCLGCGAKFTTVPEGGLPCGH